QYTAPVPSTSQEPPQQGGRPVEDYRTAPYVSPAEQRILDIQGQARQNLANQETIDYGRQPWITEGLRSALMGPQDMNFGARPWMTEAQLNNLHNQVQNPDSLMQSVINAAPMITSGNLDQVIREGYGIPSNEGYQFPGGARDVAYEGPARGQILDE